MDVPYRYFGISSGLVSRPVVSSVAPIARKVLRAFAFLAKPNSQGALRTVTAATASTVRWALKGMILTTPHSARVARVRARILPPSM